MVSSVKSSQRKDSKCRKKKWKKIRKCSEMIKKALHVSFQSWMVSCYKSSLHDPKSGHKKHKIRKIGQWRGTKQSTGLKTRFQNAVTKKDKKKGESKASEELIQLITVIDVIAELGWYGQSKHHWQQAKQKLWKRGKEEQLRWHHHRSHIIGK